MPIYLYENPKTQKVVEVIQTMSEPHEYEEKGVKFRRVFCVPQAVIDGKMDAFSETSFSNKIGNTKGSMGDVWDRAAEWSDKRAQIAGGKDPLKTKFYDEYAKKRKGKRHFNEIKENSNKTYTV